MTKKTEMKYPLNVCEAFSTVFTSGIHGLDPRGIQTG